jgi:thiamine biosynthesis lipoprotein
VTALRWPLLTGVAAAALAAGPVQAQVWRFHEPHVLGSSLDMAMVTDDPATAPAAARAARAEIDRLDRLLSSRRTDSDLTALNTGFSLIASRDLFEVVQASEDWRRRTAGAFDARLGLVTQARRLSDPDPDDLVRLRAAARASTVILDPDRRSILRPPAVVFDLDGIAKGHVIDAALAAARDAAPGLRGMMIDVGGDLRVWGQAPAAEGWRIGVADPARLYDNAEPVPTLRLLNKAVAFSGPGLRDLPGGHSHILAADGDIRRRSSAAVVADTARDADALATALCAMPPAEALALADRLDGFEALVIDETGRRLISRG